MPVAVYGLGDIGPDQRLLKELGNMINMDQYLGVSQDPFSFFGYSDGDYDYDKWMDDYYYSWLINDDSSWIMSLLYNINT